MTLHLTVIGGGPGGYEAAFAAARAGMKVTLIEKHEMGGTCLNEGCIPTKSLKASAEALELIRRSAEFGLKGSCDAVPDITAIMERKNKICSTLRTGLEKTCLQLGIQLIRGTGRVLRSGLVQVLSAEGMVHEVETDRIILASGSSILDLPVLPIDHTHILSSDDALHLSRLPSRMVIVGGGVIGCEMAGIFRSFGVDVTLVEGLNRLLPLPSVDPEISKLLLREFKKKGISCELGRTVQSAEVNNGTVSLKIGPSPFLSEHSAAQKKETEIETDVVLVCVGRVPNTNGLGLSEAGIRTDARGWVVTDDHLKTTLDNCWAIGDVLGPSKVMLAHVASTEAQVAVDGCLGKEATMNYTVVPSAIFTTPEIGCVGLSEEQARAAGMDIEVSVFQMRELGKAQAMSELAGLFKVIVDKATDRVLGVHIAGAHASDLIAEAALALQVGATSELLWKTVHAHPTLAEGLHEAVRKFQI